MRLEISVGLRFSLVVFDESKFISGWESMLYSVVWHYHYIWGIMILRYILRSPV